MLQHQYIILIQALLKATRNNTLKWDKATDNKYQYSVRPTQEQRILLDRYSAVQEGIQIPCVNMTIFSNPDEHIIDEIVLCHSLDKKDNFDLLNELYGAVETQANKENSEKINPILTHITESVQRLYPH